MSMHLIEILQSLFFTKTLDTFPVLDFEDKAKSVTYENYPGIVKRNYYPPVILANRKVVIALHQTAVTRDAKKTKARAHYTTAHRLIGPDGTRFRLHPLTCRLMATNRLDRAPWHAIAIEVMGNFEGVDGTGNWSNPEKFGRGRMSESQIQSCREEIQDIIKEVALLDGQVIGIVPHRVAGQKKGKPNKPLCPGSRVWSECGEWAGAVLGLAVPEDGQSIGGSPIPIQWHGSYWPQCEKKLRFDS